MTEERDIRLNRQRKMEEWRDSSEGYANSFRRQDSAKALQEKYRDPNWTLNVRPKLKLENWKEAPAVWKRRFE